MSAKFVCGYLACDLRPFNLLLTNLPQVIKVADRQGSDQGALGQFVRLAMTEAGTKRAGGESVLAKLSELMFIEVVRRHVEERQPQDTGWLSALRDPFVGKALALLHQNPSHHWTIAELAKKVGVSRSVLAKRFGLIVGTPPIQYLANWRMQIAAGLLLSGTDSLDSIASSVGYDSAAAFSRAFSKMLGVPPSDWRQRSPTTAVRSQSL